MPRAPVYNPATQGTPSVEARFRAPSGPSGGEMVAEAGRRLAQSVGQFAQDEDRRADTLDQDYARQLRLEYKEQADPIYTQFSVLNGKEAVDSGAVTQDRVNKLRDEVLDKATNPRMRKYAQQLLDVDALGYVEAIGRHSANQNKVMLIGTAAAEKSQASTLAVNSYGDADRHTALVDEAAAAAQRYASLRGYSPEETALEVQTAKSAIRADTIKRAITDGDLPIAQTYMAAHGDEMTPDDRLAASNALRVAVRAKEIETERQAAVVDKQMSDELAAVRNDAGRGIDVSGRLPALAQYYAQKGDKSVTSELKQIGQEAVWGQTWSKATPIQRQQRIAALNSIPVKKRTPDQQAELKYLNDKTGSLDSQYASDPVGFYIQNGSPNEVPPTLTDKADSFVARAAWAKRMGVADPLTDVEAQSLQTKLKTGPGGYEAVMNMLAVFPAQSAAAAARKVAPDDAYLQQVVTLPYETRRDALDGKAALQADKKLIAVEAPRDQERIKTVRAGFDKALGAMPQSQKNAILSLAESLAANEAHRTGEPMNNVTFERSLNRALGSVGTGPNKRGGLGGWVNGQYFLVPDGMTQNEFATRVFKWIRTNPGKGPVNPDGTPADLRSARPVAIGPRRYKWMVGDKTVMGRDGRQFEAVFND